MKTCLPLYLLLLAGSPAAESTIRGCAIYRTQIGVRVEDMIQDLKITGMAYGPEVKYRGAFHGSKNMPGYANTGEHEAPPLSELITQP